MLSCGFHKLVGAAQVEHWQSAVTSFWVIVDCGNHHVRGSQDHLRLPM
jgi:hypothetical protein